MAEQQQRLAEDAARAAEEIRRSLDELRSAVSEIASKVERSEEAYKHVGKALEKIESMASDWEHVAKCVRVLTGREYYSCSVKVVVDESAAHVYARAPIDVTLRLDKTVTLREMAERVAQTMVANFVDYILATAEEMKRVLAEVSIALKVLATLKSDLESINERLTELEESVES